MAASFEKSFHGYLYSSDERILRHKIVKSDDEDVRETVTGDPVHARDKDGGGGGGRRHLVVEDYGGGAEDVVTRYEVVLLAVLSGCDHCHHEDHQRVHHAKGVPGLLL